MTKSKYENASEDLIEKISSGKKKGSRKGTVKGNNVSTGDVMSEKGNPEGKNGCSKDKDKLKESLANLLLQNQPSEPPKGPRIKGPNGSSKATNKLKESPAELLLLSDDEEQKYGSRIKGRK